MLTRIFQHPRPRKEGSSQRSGSALVIVLGLLSVLLLMGVSFAVTMRTERSGASNMRHAALARHVLDSALARTMSDLDVELRAYETIYTNKSNKKVEYLEAATVPTNMVVLTSYAEDADAISVLSHEIARHLPSDQLSHALQTRASWKPIFGAVRVSHNDSDPTINDSPVGRYAYVVLNGCGLLDPNVVAKSGRGLGLSTEEIQLGKSSSDRLLSDPKNKTVNNFLSERKADGHYVTMRDFLGSPITNYFWNPPPRIDLQKYDVASNCFSIGSMAVEDLTPPIEMEGKKFSKHSGDGDTAVAYRLPKCSLLKDDGTLLDPSSISQEKAEEIAEAFRRSFQTSWDADGNADSFMEKNWVYGNTTTKIPLEKLVTRIFLDALDDDVYSGGTQPHRLSDINTTAARDTYMAKLGESRAWDHFPCTEPVPMLDNLVLVGGTDANNGKLLEKKDLSYTDPNTGISSVTGVQWTVSISAVMNSAYFPGWNVPKYAVGDYVHYWYIQMGQSPLETEKGVSPGDMKHFNAHFGAAFTDQSSFNTTIDNSGNKFRLQSGNPIRRRGDADVETVLSFSFVMPKDPQYSDEEMLPEKIGFTMHAFGYMTVNGDEDKVVQVAPCPYANESINGNFTEDSMLELYVSINTKDMMGVEFPVVSGTYCLDPMFAYRKDSWIPSLGMSEDPNDNELNKLREALTFPDTTGGTLADMISSGAPNPLARLYLEHPYRSYKGAKVFEILTQAMSSIVNGFSDVMWANPEDNNDFVLRADNPEIASYAFYFDPDSETNSFTRVAQLGFLPIGTYRTIALLDGFSQDNQRRLPRHRVLDYFTMQKPRDPGTDGSINGSSETPGRPHKAALFASKLNLNPPRGFQWKQKDDSSQKYLDTKGYNMRPFTAALMGCPLREWDGSANSPKLDWDTAALLAEAYEKNIARDDQAAREEDLTDRWNSDGVVHDLSVLGRAGEPSPDMGSLDSDLSMDIVLREEVATSCDFDREGVIRNSAELFTGRQQLFTILLKADSFTPKFGFNDASHGTSMASVQAIAHVWRDPEPLRDAIGIPIRDKNGNAIHPWVLLDIIQF